MYAPRMKGLCLRYVGDSEIAKDILQDGFIKVFSNIKQFKGIGSFDGWIKRIFVNTAISYIRKHEKKNKQVSFEDLDESKFLDTEIHHSDKQVDLKNENINLVISADLSELELLSALQKIPEKFRSVFNLFCIENIKHEEIAEILDIDIATSRTRLLRARSMIKQELYVICREKLTN